MQFICHVFLSQSKWSHDFALLEREGFEQACDFPLSSGFTMKFNDKVDYIIPTCYKVNDLPNSGLMCIIQLCNSDASF